MECPLLFSERIVLSTTPLREKRGGDRFFCLFGGRVSAPAGFGEMPGGWGQPPSIGLKQMGKGDCPVSTIWKPSWDLKTKAAVGADSSLASAIAPTERYCAAVT